MDVLSAEIVQKLVRVETEGTPIVSVYLNVDGRQNVRVDDYVYNLDALLRRARRNRDAKKVEEDLQKIETFVKEEFERGSTRGLSIFSSGKALWEVVVSPLPFDDHIVIDRSAHVQRLENVLDENQPTGVLLTDKQRARLLVVELGRVIARDEVNTPQPRHDDDKGNWEKDRVKQHATVIAQQHLKAAAQAMFDLYQKYTFRHLVIGTSQELAPELKTNLHDYLAQKTVGVSQIGISASDEEVLSVAWDLTQEKEREEERIDIDKLRSLLTTDEDAQSAQAVAGLSPTLRVIAEKRAEKMLVVSGFASEGKRCLKCNYLSTSDSSCAMCSGEMEDVDDVVEGAIEQALAQKCHVEFCHDAPDLVELGSVGAILRY